MMDVERLGLSSLEETKLRLLSDAAFVFESEYGFLDYVLDDETFNLIASTFTSNWHDGVRDHLDQAYTASSVDGTAIPMEEIFDWYENRLGLLTAYEISRAGLWLADILARIQHQRDSK